MPNGIQSGNRPVNITVHNPEMENVGRNQPAEDLQPLITGRLGTGNSFEANSNKAELFSPFAFEQELFDMMGAAADKADGFTAGAYGRGKDKSSFSSLNFDQNTANTNWRQRSDWNNADGVTRGARNDQFGFNSTKIFSGSRAISRDVGIEAKLAGQVKGQHGTASGSVRAYSELGAKASTGFDITNTGFDASVGANAHVVAAGVEAHGQIVSNGITVGGERVDVNADVFGKATVEANAGVSAKIGVDLKEGTAVLEGRLGAFAGAKAYGRARFGVGDILKVGVYGEGWAGIGAEAAGHIKLEDGKFSLGANAGAGLGLGGKVGFQVQFDAKKAAHVAMDVADRDRNGKLTLNDAATGINQSADVAMTGIENAVDSGLNKLDADKDGRFSRRDLGIHAMRMQHQFQQKFDVNGDGKIGFSDAATGLRRSGQKLGQRFEQAGNSVRKGANRVSNFAQDAVDLNNDGKFGVADVAVGAQRTVQAFQRGNQALRSVAAQAGDVIADGSRKLGQAAFSAADVNNDGKLGLNDVVLGANQARAAVNRGLDVAGGAAIRTGEALIDGSKKLGQAAFSAADVNNDGKLGLNDVALGARNTARTVRRAATSTAKAVHGAADRDGDGKLGLNDVALGASQAKEAISDAAVSTGRAISNGAQTVKNAASRFGSEVATQATEAASTLADGASRTYSRAKSTVGRVASFFGW